jgi:ABC-type polysaccharide/polyol phosphate transport system ATPase subunit
MEETGILLDEELAQGDKEHEPEAYDRTRLFLDRKFSHTVIVSMNAKGIKV